MLIQIASIQLVLALAPLHFRYGVKRVIVSTYQSEATGTGVKAVKQMNNERNSIDSEMAYPYQIDLNCIPQCDDFGKQLHQRRNEINQ